MISFEEQVAAIRQHLASIYEREQNWREAANVLVGIPLETGQKYAIFTVMPGRFLSNVLIFINSAQTIHRKL